MMFGITTPDAIALGMMLIAVVAILKGGSSGQAAKEKAVRDAAMVSIEGGIVQANQLGDYIKVLNKLAIAMLAHAEAIKAQQDVRIAKFTNVLQELADKIDRKFDEGGRHGRR